MDAAHRSGDTFPPWQPPDTCSSTTSKPATTTSPPAACAGPGSAAATNVPARTTPTAGGGLSTRLLLLARCFAVEIYAYAVMSNHFHIVLHYDPNACQVWSDEGVARRWTEALPPKPRRGDADATKAAARESLLRDPARLARARRTLGSLSHFMKHLRILASSCACKVAVTYYFDSVLLRNIAKGRAVRVTTITTFLQLFAVAFPPRVPAGP